MGRIRGIDVKLYHKQKTGEDSLGNPIYDESEYTTVSNVLVAPASDEEILDTQNLHGKKVVYVLAIPKGDTNNWEERKIEFFNQTFRSFGIPVKGIDELVPTDWNMKVKVERYE